MKYENFNIEWVDKGISETDAYIKPLKIHIGAELDKDDNGEYEVRLYAEKYSFVVGDPNLPQRSLLGIDIMSRRRKTIHLGKLEDPYPAFKQFVKERSQAVVEELVDEARGIARLTEAQTEEDKQEEEEELN